ncbi:MAG: hypothetical protein KJ060_21460 [Candidatus Hydrogenedentes bacterium]|nr:hypothetical protein [Candidatus Hydrogenedentota bacterium]
MIRSKLRIGFAASLLVAGLLCVAYGRLFEFAGEIRIRTGSAEAIAVGPPSPFRMNRSSLRKYVPGRKIPFANLDDARGWIDADRYYDVASLPFAIAIAGADLKADREVGGTLIVVSAESETRVSAESGRNVSVGGNEFTIGTVRPWSGLVHAPGNPPMAELTLFAGDESAGAAGNTYFVPDGAWIRANNETALHFRWVASANDREQAMDEGQRRDVARWGIVSEEQGEWLTSFQPGSGLVTADGSSIVLLQRDDAHAGPGGATSAIEVALETSEGVERRWVQANETVPGFPVRYENLLEMPRVLHVIAWEPERATVYPAMHGARGEPAVLDRGETWVDAGLRLRLDDVQPSATAVNPDASSQFEVVLDGRDREFAVPENSPVQIASSHVAFEARVQPAKVSYQVAIYRPGQEQPEVLDLGPATALNLDGWQVQQDANRHTSADLAVLRLRKRSPGLATIAGISLCIGATLLFLTARRAGAQ